MGKLPGFTFYTGDWLKDPELRRCSKAAKGVWVDMLALMFECADRGVFSTGGRPWSDQEIAAAVGGDMAENLSCIAELLLKGVAHRNESGAIFCKRMVRDQSGRLLTQARVKKHRSNGSGNAVCNASVTPMYEQEQEDVSDFVFEVFKAFPSNSHRKQPSRIEQEVVMEAIVLDGKELVLAGTKGLADAVARWPRDELKFVPNFEKFFKRQEYLVDPLKWERKQTNHESAMAIIERLAKDDDQETSVGAAQGGNG